MRITAALNGKDLRFNRVLMTFRLRTKKGVGGVEEKIYLSMYVSNGSESR